MPGDPADVGGAPVDVGLGVQVVDDGVGVGRLREVAAGGVQDALGLSGRAGGVEDVERVLGRHRLRLVVVALPVDEVVPPHVLVGPLDVGPGAAHDEHVLDRGVLARHGLVDGGLERSGLALAVLPVGGDDHAGLGVGDAGADGVGAEPAEHHRVRGAEAGAGQHRHDRLGDHGQVDRDPVALGHTQLGEGVGGLADAALQLGIRDRLGAALGALEVDGDPLAVAGLDVPVDAVVGDVELAVGEPRRERRVAPVQDLGEVLAPGDVLPRLVGPEALEVGVGLVEQLGLPDRLLGERGVRRELLRGVVRAVRQVRHGRLLLESGRLPPSQPHIGRPCQATGRA